jgi:hypothetical protein
VCGKSEVAKGIRTNVSEAPDNLVNYANMVGVSDQVAVKGWKDISNTIENREDIKTRRKRGPPMVNYSSPSTKIKRL